VERSYYYYTGKLFQEVNYRNDTIIGTIKEYYQSGKIKDEATFNNGVKEITNTYDENGNEIK
jgi:antitoxin component YwqK of YwqJK toxin-antitoxin module